MSFATTDANKLYTTASLPAGSYTLRCDPRRSGDKETEQYTARTPPAAVAVCIGKKLEG